MMTPPFVLHVSGAPCSGKSTLERLLEPRLPGTYLLAYDRLKWQLAGYDRTKDGPLVDELLLGFYEVACRKGVPVLLDFFFNDAAEHAACVRIAARHGYRFLDIELTAPLPVLVARFHKRLADAERTGARITVTTEEVFLETVAKPFYVPPGTPRFDTAETPMEEVAAEVARMLAA